MVLLGTLVVLLLAETSLFIFALLLKILACRFRSEALILSVISESITRSAIASLVAAVIAVTALTIAVTAAITLTAFHTRTTLSVKSASLRSAIAHTSSVTILSALTVTLSVATLTIVTIAVSVVTVVTALATLVLSTVVTIILTVTALTVIAVVTVTVLRSVCRSGLCHILCRLCCLRCLCGCSILYCLLLYRCLCLRLFRRLLSTVAGYHCHAGSGRRRGQRLDGTYGSLCLNTVAVRIILVTIVLVSAALIRTLSACISLSLSTLSTLTTLTLSTLSTLTALTLSGHLGILRVANENNLFLLFRLLSRFGLLGNFRFLSLCFPCGCLSLFLSRLCVFGIYRSFLCCGCSCFFLSEAVAYQCCRILFQRALCCLCLNSFFL